MFWEFDKKREQAELLKYIISAHHSLDLIYVSYPNVFCTSKAVEFRNISTVRDLGSRPGTCVLPKVFCNSNAKRNGDMLKYIIGAYLYLVQVCHLISNSRRKKRSLKYTC